MAATPTVIAGRYEVLGKLGQGGQGSVYKVRHVELDEILALKLQLVLLGSEPSFERMWDRDKEIAGLLSEKDAIPMVREQMVSTFPLAVARTSVLRRSRRA